MIAVTAGSAARPYRRNLACFLILSVVAAVLTVATPVIAGEIVDTIVEGVRVEPGDLVDLLVCEVLALVAETLAHLGPSFPGVDERDPLSRPPGVAGSVRWTIHPKICFWKRPPALSHSAAVRPSRLT